MIRIEVAHAQTIIITRDHVIHTNNAINTPHAGKPNGRATSANGAGYRLYNYGK